MSVLVDKAAPSVHPPGERADAEAPSSVDAAQADDPIVATSDEGVQVRQSDARRFWRKLIEAANQAKATCLAREAAGGAAPAPTTKDVLPAAPCDVATAGAEAPSRLDAARVQGPLVESGKRAIESDPPTLYMWRLLFDALNQAKAPCLAPEEPEVAAPAPPPKDVLPAAPCDVVIADVQAPSGADPARVQGQFVVPGDRVQESEPATNSFGRPPIEAFSPVETTWVAPEAPVAAAPAPPMREALPTLPFHLATVAAALDHLTTEKEVMAAVMKFVTDAEQVLIAASDRVAVLTDAFGSECVATVTEASEAAVVTLAEEAAVTGAPVTDQAAVRIVRRIIDRATLRASRTMALAPRTPIVPRVRTQRAPRARRAPRRAVRLSAVASAGDGPPPKRPPAPARTQKGGRFSFGRAGPNYGRLPEVNEAHAALPAPRGARPMSRRSPALVLSDDALRHPEVTS
jgi:hypothetical protein